MRVTILTLFPDMFRGPFDHSIIKKAQEKNAVDIQLVNIRDFAPDKYKSVDDHPYGGGAGMIMRVDVVDRALESVKSRVKSGKRRTVLLDPQGKPYTQAKAKELSQLDHLILICGHYEGVDERIRDLVDEEISIGDYVTTGGELPAMVIADSVVRLLPGVLRDQAATSEESFGTSMPSSLEFPQYTKPPVYKGRAVPAVLLSGNHQAIAAWRKHHSLLRTKTRRPDLIKK